MLGDIVTRSLGITLSSAFLGSAQRFTLMAFVTCGDVPWIEAIGGPEKEEDEYSAVTLARTDTRRSIS